MIILGAHRESKLSGFWRSRWGCWRSLAPELWASAAFRFEPVSGLLRGQQPGSAVRFAGAKLPGAAGGKRSFILLGSEA